MSYADRYSGIIKHLIQILVLVLIFGFFGYYLYNAWGQLPEYNWNFNYYYLVLSGLLLLFLPFLTVYLYHIILKKINVNLNIKHILGVRLVSDMGRYIPGKVWLVVGRIYFFKKLGVPKTKVLLSMIIEMPVMILAGFLLFFITLLCWNNISQFHPQLMILALLPILLLAIHPKFLNWMLNLALRILKRDKIKLNLSYYDILKLILLFTIYWLVYGFGFALLIHSVYPVGLLDIIKMAGIYPIAWTIGYLSFLTPGGIGVREGVLAYLLSFIMPLPVAIVFSLLARIWLTVFEGIAALFALKFIKR